MAGLQQVGRQRGSRAGRFVRSIAVRQAFDRPNSIRPWQPPPQRDSRICRSLISRAVGVALRIGRDVPGRVSADQLRYRPPQRFELRVGQASESRRLARLHRAGVDGEPDRPKRLRTDRTGWGGAARTEGIPISQAASEEWVLLQAWSAQSR